MIGTAYFHLNHSEDDVRVSVTEHHSGIVSVAVNADGFDVALFLRPAQFEYLRKVLAAFEWKPEAPPAPEDEGQV